MFTSETIRFLVLGPIVTYFVLVILKFLHRVWWRPIQIQRVMGQQGIKGPTYKFFFGNTKEIAKKKAIMRSPMDLSHDVFTRIMPHIHSWINTYGKTFLFWNGCKAELVVIEPELVKEILSNGRSYTRTDANKYLKKIIGDSIVACEGEKWVKLRKVANLAFHAENLKNMIPAMVESIETMLERWNNYEGREIDVCEHFTQLTAEVISRTAFGSSYKEGEQIFQMLTKLVILIGKNAYKISLPNISHVYKNRDEIESEKIEKQIRELVLNIIKKREKVVMDEAQTFGSDLLGLLLKSRHEAIGENKISLDEIVEECKTFYSAGQGTTQILLSWTILLLAIHSDWQEKARDEVLNVFGRQSPNSDGLPRLRTMNMIINESLRLYPPIAFNERKAKKGARLGNLIIPPDVKLYVPILALHLDRKIWGDDAHLFKPERFTKGVVGATNNNLAAFLPFGMGPRTCVGMNFAINEAKIALSMILQRYAFTLSPKYIHSPIDASTIRPQHGVQVVLHGI